MTELPPEEHESILNNPEADRRLAERAIERAVSDGMSLEEATQLYGVREQQDKSMTVGQMNQLISDALKGLKEPSIDTPEARRLYPGIVRDVEQAAAKGLTIAMVNDFD